MDEYGADFCLFWTLRWKNTALFVRLCRMITLRKLRRFSHCPLPLPKSLLIFNVNDMLLHATGQIMPLAYSEFESIRYIIGQGGLEYQRLNATKL